MYTYMVIYIYFFHYPSNLQHLQGTCNASMTSASTCHVSVTSASPYNASVTLLPTPLCHLTTPLCHQYQRFCVTCNASVSSYIPKSNYI